MRRDVRRSSRGRGAEAAGLSTAIEAVVDMMITMRPLRRECARAMARHAAGVADAADLHRYQMARLRLLMLEATNACVQPPRRASEVLAQRSELDFLALIGRSDPSPEPQPS